MITIGAPPLPLVEEISACGLLSVNPYRACDIRCAYCITGAQGPSRPRVGLAHVRAQLRRELGAQAHRQHRVGLGTLCDAYPSVEAELGVTRVVLDELISLGWPVRIVTKGVGVRRDIDLIRRGDCTVTVSVTTLDHDVVARLEPGAPAPEERLDLVRDLADAGIRVWVSAAPWIPGSSDVESISRIVGPAVRICVAPLNVESPEVKRTGFGRRYSQREIDLAYLAAWRRSVPSPSVVWLPPITAERRGSVEQSMARLAPPVAAAPAVAAVADRG